MQSGSQRACPALAQLMCFESDIQQEQIRLESRSLSHQVGRVKRKTCTGQEAKDKPDLMEQRHLS